MKKNRIIIVLSILIFLISIFMLKYNDDNSLFNNKYVYNLNVNYDDIQNNIDKEISKYIKNKKIGMNNPKVILDPYNSSPLTALVIFYTKDSTSIKLYINDIYMTTVEKSKSHIIPIYGLREDYNNIIKLIDDNNNESIINIKTDKLENSNFYTYKSTNNTNEHLFITSPKGKYAIDNEGYMSWYMNMNNNEMDLSSDKKIYFIDKFYRLIETDFMGKVYQAYYTDAFYNNHKVKKLNNNNIMVINSNFNVCEIDYKTGEILYSIDLSEILQKIDNDFNMSFENNYINYFQYNEEDKTLLVSIRGISAIINYDLLNNEIIWILSNNDIFSDKFDKYKLNLINGEYFIGQHTPYLKDNKLYVFNNNNFIFHDADFSLAKKSSVIIYEINDMNIKEIYRYKSNYSSGWYGSFYEQDEIKNINFGCIVGEEEGNYSKVIELDKNNNIITELTTNYDNIIIYESFRNEFYNEITPNYPIDIEYNKLYSDELMKNNLLKEGKNSLGFRKKIQNAIIDETLFDFETLGIMANNITKMEILFVDKNYKYYKLDYDPDKKADKKNIIYLGDYFLNIKGKYALYVKINDKYYNTSIVYNIK
ncbi:MAG: aryl-sulfate sulfotransferase [Bacilli bacterium]|nr:aryl-sulfate sulfotransferase [Bacilli bacterium]